MAQEPAGWYTDPTGNYSYRYWDGLRWSSQVNSGGNTGTDPNPLDPQVASTPPAPGTAAPEPAAPPTQPTVQVTQSGGGTSSGAMVGLIVAAIAIVVLVIVLLSGSGEDAPDSSTPPDAPATTEAPPATEAPAEPEGT